MVIFCKMKQNIEWNDDLLRKRGGIMYKTRRFKALNGAEGKYSRIVDKIAIYATPLLPKAHPELINIY